MPCAMAHHLLCPASSHPYVSVLTGVSHGTNTQPFLPLRHPCPPSGRQLEEVRRRYEAARRRRQREEPRLLAALRGLQARDGYAQGCWCVWLVIAPLGDVLRCVLAAPTC